MRYVQRPGYKHDDSLSLKEAFEAYMPGPPPPEGIPWWWTGGVNNSYGRFRADKKRYLAHHASYMLFVGPIPKGLIVRHKFDKPLDVNPHHLLLGTHQDNMKDMVRNNGQCQGERHHSAQLNTQIVREIRKLDHFGFTYREIARIFGYETNERIIRRVIDGVTWKTVR